ncbi:MAG: major facilitator superfamily 1 [Symbiobacteriaceae bacterium]|jgi:GPH family glycoside/pentoside/hexuronide:cation symporter|nr:major facilitator superfamily 1 [Symbiobacteriaceae bacterium]
MKRATGTLAKVLYSSANISNSLTAQFFSTFILFYYVDTLKMSPALAGLGMAIYGIWNGINDPLLGQLSDRTRTRWGRRIPYVLFGTIPLALAFWLVWVPPTQSPGLLFAWFMGAIFLYDTLYTLVVLNWTALFPEMYPSLAERSSVSVIRQVMAIIGMIIGTALPPMLGDAIGWGTTAGIFAVVAALFLGLSLLGSYENPAHAEKAGLALWPALKATFANRSFVTFVTASMLIQFTFVLLTGTIPFYAKYVLGADSFMTTMLLGIIFVMALPLVGMWGRLTIRWGPRTTMMVAAALFGLLLIPFAFVEGVVGGLVTAAMVAIGLSGLLVLFDIFIADIVDEDELKTGVRREGMYFGIHGLMIRLGISLQALITGQVLSRTGYSADLTVQPAGALTGLRLLMTVVPIAAIALAIVAIWLYPLHGQRLTAMRKAAELRAAR